MKKMIALMLATALILSLVACGSQEPPANEAPATVSSVEAVVVPTPENVMDTETLDDDTTPVSDNLYAEVESQTETEVESILSQLEEEWGTVSGAVTDYHSYIANSENIENMYIKVYVGSAYLCVKMRGYAILYAEEILASGRSADEMYEDLEGIYDVLYDDMGEDIYDGIYDGVLDDMYDGLYDGALDDQPEDVAYADWSDARSSEYDMWSDMRSEVYDQWSDYRSDVYDFWSDLRSDVYGEDFEDAREEIDDFTKDFEEMWGELMALIEGGQTEETQAEDPQPEEATAEVPAEQPPTDGIRLEFKAAMDSYEEFFDDYVEFMKSYMEDPVSMMGEYASMMQQYVETMAALEAIDDGTLSDEEAIYYAEVTLRINQKLLGVV